MPIPKEVAKNFADIIKESTENKQNEIYIKATVHSKDEQGNLTVLLDGNTVAIPVENTMDAEPNDRVMVMIKNHEATIVGNLTAPASARTATSFMKLFQQGLVIGNFDFDSVFVINDKKDYFDGDGIEDTYRLTETLYGISTLNVEVDDQEKILDTDYTYNLDTNSITFFQQSIPDEDSTIIVNYKYETNEKATYLLLTGDDYRIYKVLGDHIDPDNDIPLLIVGDQGMYGYGEGLLIAGTQDALATSSISLEEGVLTLLSAYNRQFAKLIINASNQTLKFNNKNVVVADQICKTGQISVTQTINANSYKQIISGAINIPSGYTLMGIRAISQNHLSACQMTAFGVNASNNTCNATFYNRSGSNQSTTVTFYYFCIRTS